jgi:nitrogen regulatory protein PII
MLQIELGFVIVSDGMGSRVVSIAKRNGIRGATIYIGRGTEQSPLLKFLDIVETRKEIVLTVSEKNKLRFALDVLNTELSFKKPHHGIAFTIPVSRVYGFAGANELNLSSTESEETAMHQLICTIVEKGAAEDVIDAAKTAGSRGGTIVNARGSGIHETLKVFGMNIEPEKEIVLILAEKSTVAGIVSAISEKLKIDKPGRGIIFVQDVTATYGLY